MNPTIKDRISEEENLLRESEAEAILKTSLAQQKDAEQEQIEKVIETLKARYGGEYECVALQQHTGNLSVRLIMRRIDGPVVLFKVDCTEESMKDEYVRSSALEELRVRLSALIPGSAVSLALIEDEHAPILQVWDLKDYLAAIRDEQERNVPGGLKDGMMGHVLADLIVSGFELSEKAKEDLSASLCEITKAYGIEMALNISFVGPEILKKAEALLNQRVSLTQAALDSLTPSRVLSVVVRNGAVVIGPNFTTEEDRNDEY